MDHETSADRRKRFHKHLYRQVQWEDLDPEFNSSLIARAIHEDIGGGGFRGRNIVPGDPTSELFLAPDKKARARLVARESLVMAGLPLAKEILRQIDDELTIECHTSDGTSASAGDSLALLTGPSRSLFTAERTLLNFLQMLSGIATETHRLSSLLQGTSTRLLDTRKTPPGYRALAKYAVSVGGGWNHRLGLYDRIMLKDNHLATTANLTAEDFARAVSHARQTRPDLPIEIEIDSLQQLPLVLPSEPDVILLDNFSRKDLAEGVRLIAGLSLTEASGNITAESIPALATLGLDFISTGATIHRSRWMDLGLDIES